MLYLYIKSFHLIFLIAWMVSLLYLPRLFVYHSNLSRIDSSYDLFLLMEIRLIKIISIPAMILTLFFGFFLLYLQSEFIYENYFIIKILAVVLLIIYQFFLFLTYLDFKKRKNNRSRLFFKILNEVPTFLMIIIILLVVLKPNLG